MDQAVSDEYAGIVGKIRFFWRFRCVKLRVHIEMVGLVGMFAFGTMTILATIYQWYIPSHIVTINWNYFGEAHTEYIMALIALPCGLYFIWVNFQRLSERWY